MMKVEKQNCSNKIQNKHEFLKTVKEKGNNINSENVEMVSDVRINDICEKNTRNEQWKMTERHEMTASNEKCDMNIKTMKI